VQLNHFRVQSSLSHKERYDVYRSFKSIFVKEQYLNFIDVYCFRVAITQARVNVLPLNNNVYRYSDNIRDKLCPFCKTNFENEAHFLLECYMYSNLREKFLSKCINVPLTDMFKVRNDEYKHSLSNYIFHSINKRKIMLAQILYWKTATI